MNKKSLLALAIAPLLLASCNGTTKVKFEKFQEEVKAIEDVKKIEEQTIKGKYGDNETKFELSKANTIAEFAVAAIVNKEVLAGYALTEVSGMEYYTGNGFKIKTEKKTVKWNKYGHVTSYEAADANFTVSYKYAK